MHGFEWVSFYEACADALLNFRDKRHALYEKTEKLASQTELAAYLHFERREMWEERDFEIDPFTVMGIFNRGVTAEHREKLATFVAQMLGVSLAPPRQFHGIAHLDPRKSIFDGNSQLWNLFEAALSPSPGNAFISAFDQAMEVKGNGAGMLTIGLFWVRPLRFMAIDKISEPYIAQNYGLRPLPEKCSGREYVGFLEKLKDKLGDQKDTFPAVAYAAWNSVHGSGA